MDRAKIYEINEGKYTHLVLFRRKGIKEYKRRFKNAGDAKADCEAYNEKLINEGAEGIHISPSDRHKVITALRILQGTGISIVKAAEIAKKQWEGQGAGVLLSPLLWDFLEYQERKQLDPKTINDYKWRLKAFFEFSKAKRVEDFKGQAVQDFAFSQKSASSGRNMIKACSAFASFLVRKDYLKLNPCKDIERPRKKIKEEIAILSSYQSWRFLRRLEREKPQCVGFYAVLLFAYLRPSEAEALEAKDFRKTTIKVDKGKMRGMSRRLVPYSESLRAWLDKYPFKVPSDRQQRACRELCPVDWVTDICRHTGISNRVALTKDLKAVALESGNSPAVILSDYFELIEEREAEFFAARIRPLR